MSRERKEFIEQMFDKLEGLPIENTIGRRINLIPRGRHLMGLCPFHNDTRLGSFLVTPDKRMWKCFACGEDTAGNAIKFVSMYDNLNYLDAAFKIAYEEGIISLDEYQIYSSYTYDKKYVRSLKDKYEVRQEKLELKKAPDDVCHNVYLFMQRYFGVNKIHHGHLLYVRKLSEERIKRDYFSMKTTEKKKFIEALKEKFPFYSDDTLSKVPGFFIDAKNRLTYSGFQGIGILIRDSYGKILAVQIRKDTVKEGEQRYVWFSSAFAGYDERYKGGCGTNSPLDVLYPSQFNAKKCLCITEGRFKSEKLIEYGNYAISAQGISNWKGITKCIQELRTNALLSQVFIMYDSDLLSNMQGLKHAKNLSQEIKKAFPDLRVRAAFWKAEYGKGIDDVAIAGNIKEVRYFEDINNIYMSCTKTANALLKTYGYDSFQKMPLEPRQKYKKELQALNEHSLLDS